MSEPIVGIDASHWNQVDWTKVKAAGVRFAWIKVSQGVSYRDTMAALHYAGAKQAGILVGPYHFATQEDALMQATNARAAIDAIGAWDLRPAIDCEAYASVGGGEVKGVIEINEMSADYAIHGVSYPTQAGIDTIGRKLINWYGSACIYTNPSSGNRIFTSPIMGERYALWVAHWGVATPTMPKMWKGRPYLAHQVGVVDGQKYGVKDKIDLNHWGTLLPFPGQPEPPPPPPDDDYLECKVTTNKGVYKGRLTHE